VELYSRRWPKDLVCATLKVSRRIPGSVIEGSRTLLMRGLVELSQAPSRDRVRPPLSASSNNKHAITQSGQNFNRTVQSFRDVCFAPACTLSADEKQMQARGTEKQRGEAPSLVYAAMQCSRCYRDGKPVMRSTLVRVVVFASLPSICKCV
jgi:hypothetical protein